MSKRNNSQTKATAPEVTATAAPEETKATAPEVTATAAPEETRVVTIDDFRSKA